LGSIFIIGNLDSFAPTGSTPNRMTRFDLFQCISMYFIVHDLHLSILTLQYIDMIRLGINIGRE